MTKTIAAFAAAALALAAPGSRALAAAIWTPTAMPWKLAKANAPLPRLPAEIPIADKANAVAASSAQVNVFGRGEPIILRLTLSIIQGQVGVLLVSPDGHTALSSETKLPPSSEDAYVYFRIRSKQPPAMIVIRNANSPDQSGMAQLERVDFVREADLDNDELTAIVDSGLN